MHAALHELSMLGVHRCTTRSKRALLCAALLALSFHSSRALAQATPEHFSSVELRELDRVLAEDARSTRIWWLSFVSVQSALLAFGGTLAALRWNDPGARAEALINLSSSGLGLGSLLIFRPHTLSASRRYRAVLSRGGSHAEAEAVVLDVAAEQAFASGWVPYLAGASVGMAVALPLWLRFDRKVGAVSAAVGSLVFTMAQTLSYPTRTLDFVRQRSRREKSTLALSVSIGLGGLALNGAF